MHKINLKKPLTDLAGKPVMQDGKEIILSEAMAGLIVQDQGGDPLKLTGLCEKLYQTGLLEVDDSDLDVFQKAVETNRYVARLLQGQVLREILRQKKSE